MSFFLKFHIKKLFFKMFESMIFKIDIKKKNFFFDFTNHISNI